VSNFKNLGVSAPILRALASEGYETPTPIQIQALPIVLGGRDLIGIAQTGTGKTAAFALPMLERLAANPVRVGARTCRALVLAPTRELAAQIGASFRTYGRFTGLTTTVVFGGASMFKQKEALARGVDILVATPGRLLDHVESKTLRLDKVEILVLDEADHMLDLGFIHALREIASLVPAKRQSLFFSATMPAPIAELAGRFLTDPARVAVAPVAATAERVTQAVVHVEQARKQDVLHSLLEDRSIERALVFTRTKHGADRVVRRLAEAGFPAEAIHGNKSQGQRTRALDAFKKGRARLLIATEIAARGIDVDGVTHVINFDLPNVPEQYVHRIGRTARAGREGTAISFCAPDERPFLKDIERLTKQSVPVMARDQSLTPPVAGERAPKPQRRPQKPPRDRKPRERRPEAEPPREGAPRPAHKLRSQGDAKSGRKPNAKPARRSRPRRKGKPA
jgi:ATP-dependent RNA helicase RhlE